MQEWDYEKTFDGNEQLTPKISVKVERLAREEPWTNDLREALIDEVRACSELWDVKSPSFKDAHGKDVTWFSIAENINRDYGTNFTVPSIKRQWKNLRDSFFKKKDAISKVTTGSGADAVQEKWRFFKPLMFLLGQTDAGPRLSNAAAEGPRSTIMKEKLEASSSSVDDIDKENEPEPKRLCAPRKRTYGSPKNAIVSKLYDTLDTLKGEKRRDEFDVFGEHVANTLRSMHDQDKQLANAMKVEITEVLCSYEKELLL